MKKNWELLLEELEHPKPFKANESWVAYYPREDYKDDFPVWYSSEDSFVTDLKLCIGDGAPNSGWPANVDGGGTEFYNSVALPWLIIVSATNIPRDMWHGYTLDPLDGRYLNCTRENIMIGKKNGNEYDKQFSLADIAKTIEIYGIYVQDNIDRLFCMAKKVIKDNSI